MSTRLKYANEAAVLADFVIDQGGVPCFWPLYGLRCRLGRQFPRWNGLIWGDWR